MSGYEFEGKNCFVYTDERFGEIRTVIDPDGERRFVGIDIAECMGFEAPTKAVKRSNIPGKMLKVPWVSGIGKVRQMPGVSIREKQRDLSKTG